MTTITASFHPAYLLGETFGNWLKSITAGWQDYRSFLRTKAELQALSDRELADIGINRWMIDDIAREAVGGHRS